ncbi:Ubiquitin C-terminal hydrolase 12 [Linum grandiflorum]
MGRGEKQPAKIDEEEAGAQKEPNVVVDLTDDDDLEANEDLSLKIVEKSVLKSRAKLESDVNGVVNLCDDTNLEDNEGAGLKGNGGGVAKSSSSSSLETEVIVEGPNGVTKKKRKKKKKISVIEGGEQSVIIIEDEEKEIEPIAEGDGADEKMKEAQDAELVESVEISDNIVLKKLLRGPRYFDPPDSGWPSCFKCGEDGHMAVNCTTSRKKKPCFVCGSLDHGPKQCGKGRDCYICRTAGHRAKDCPERLKGIAQTSKICLKCGGSGHEMYTCRNSYAESDLKEIQCYICKRFGHLCCVNDVDDGGFMLSCYRCGTVGHTGMACSRISNQATTTDTTASPSSCYRCGAGGHFARDCTTPSTAGKRIRESSAPTLKPHREIFTGQNSAPPDVGKSSKKRKTKKSKQEGESVTDKQPPTPPSHKKQKQRGGWITEYIEDYDSDSKPESRHHTKPSPKKKLKQENSGSKSQPSQKKSKKKKKSGAVAIEDHHQNPLPQTPPSKKKSKQHKKMPKQWFSGTAHQPPPPLTPPPYRNYNNMHTSSSSSHYQSPTPHYQRFQDHPPPYQPHYSSPPFQAYHHQQQTRYPEPFHGGGHRMPPPYHHDRFSGRPPPFHGGQQPSGYHHHHQHQHQHQHQRFSGSRYGNSGSEYGEYSSSYDDLTRYRRNYDWRYQYPIVCKTERKPNLKSRSQALVSDPIHKPDKTAPMAEAKPQYIRIQVSRDADFRDQIGKIRYFDLVDHSKVKNFRVPSHLCFNLFKEMVAEELGIPVQFQRFWLWANRENHTYRPFKPVAFREQIPSVVEVLKEVPGGRNKRELNLFLEDLRPVPPPHNIEGDILLFVKLYEPEKEELRYVGKLFVNRSSKPREVLAKLNEMAGFWPAEAIDLYEEITFQPNLMVEAIHEEITFAASQLENGDIVCFQKSPSLETRSECQYPTIPEFYAYLRGHQLAFEDATEDEAFLLSARFIAMKKELKESSSEAKQLRDRCQYLEKQLKDLNIHPEKTKDLRVQPTLVVAASLWRSEEGRCLMRKYEYQK